LVGKYERSTPHSAATESMKERGGSDSLGLGSVLEDVVGKEEGL